MNMQVASVPATGKFQFFMPIAKVDKAKRTVSGYASTPAIDSDGEIVSLKAVREALPGYMEFGNIREMHKLSAVGTTKEANIDEKGLYITAKIVDNSAWEKCVEGVYKGFSIGGQKLAKSGNIITKIDMAEISVVDRPANPEAKFDCVKMAKPGEEVAAVLVKVRAPRSPEAKAAMQLAKTVRTLVKAADGFSAQAGPEPVLQELPPDVATIGKAEGKEPYGDVEYADPGHQADGKKRYPVDTPDHVRAAWSYINKKKNAGKYSPEHLASVKAKIVSAWKTHVDKDGPPSAQGKIKKVKYSERMAKAFAEVEALALPSLQPQAAREEGADLGLDFLSLNKVAKGNMTIEPPPVEPDFLNLPLRKGMGTVGSLSYAFESIRSAQRSLAMEGKDEGGDGKDKALSGRLGSIAKELAGVIGDKALHEGDEAVTMSDTDDKWVNQSLGKAKAMNIQDMVRTAVLEVISGGGEALAKAKKADMGECLKGVRSEMKEARKARKSAMEDIEKAHSMCKANFLAKAAKAKGKEKPDGDGDEFDSAECMKALSSAYASMQKATGFEKSAKNFLAKAESMAAESPTSGNAHYEVPAGVRALSVEDLAAAGPGGTERGTKPPMYPDDGSVYPGKAQGAGNLAKYAKNGQVSVEVAQLIADNERLSGQVEFLGNQPRGGARPHAFNLNKVNAGFGNGQEARDATATIFKGVDVNAIGSGNEEAHKAASAKAIGNLILSPTLGKSVFDPSFKGLAGTGTH